MNDTTTTTPTARCRQLFQEKGLDTTTKDMQELLAAENKNIGHHYINQIRRSLMPKEQTKPREKHKEIASDNDVATLLNSLENPTYQNVLAELNKQNKTIPMLKFQSILNKQPKPTNTFPVPTVLQAIAQAKALVNLVGKTAAQEILNSL